MSKRKSKTGENPLQTLTGKVAAGPSPFEQKYPTASYRLPPKIAAAIKSIAEEEGLQVGQVAAFALSHFVGLYRSGELKIPVREDAAVRKTVVIP